MITAGIGGRTSPVILSYANTGETGQRMLPGAVSYGVMRVPTDPIGTCSVTFSGVNAGSEIRVYIPGAIEAAGVENCAADHTLTWSAYSAGNANNTVRIVIIHPDYKIKEFEYVSSVGNQSIPVQQERDKWYSNPV